jgi:hypothetical protein
MLRRTMLPVAAVCLCLPDAATAFGYEQFCLPPVVVVHGPVVPVFSQPIYAPYAPVVFPECPPATATINPPSSTPTVVPERMTPKTETPKELIKEPELPSERLAVPKEATEALKPSRGDDVPPLTIPKQDLPVKPEKKQPVKEPELPGFKLPVPPEKKEPMGTGTQAKDDLPDAPLALPKLSMPGDAAVKPAEPVQPVGGSDLELPKLDLPKIDTPAQPVEANKKSVSNASPITSQSRVDRFDIYPVEGRIPASPTANRLIGFINKSERDILLTVEGKSVILPSKSLIRTELPVTFTWQLGAETEREETVPTIATGLDIVIRK